MMNYNHPDNVRSPRSYAKHISSLYDGGEKGFSIAILEDCNGNYNIGVRWNVSEKEWGDRRKTEEGKLCVGMPQSRGYSVWFILPDTLWQFVPQMIINEIAVNGRKNKINISDKEIQDEVDGIIAERFGYRK